MTSDPVKIQNSIIRMLIICSFETLHEGFASETGDSLRAIVEKCVQQRKLERIYEQKKEESI